MNLHPNQVFKLATDIVCHTSQSVFLTGKAGTGKTTFLRHICNTVAKNVIVAAPTGVAAINAGGVTLHSLLQLPFEPFVPDMEGKKKLDYHFKLRKSKIEMLQELELLIIDEVSMLRVDMVDAIDFTLRRYRNSSEPFGGVQMLFIGDLFQLPPVVQNHEWNVLKEYYASPFFFHAQAFDGRMPLYIELKEIYRQNDPVFIDILSRVRNDETTQQDLDRLNQNYNPKFHSDQNNKYITLCTHNYRADQINKTELERLPEKNFSFSGSVKGNFAENSYPTELELSLKVGAQIMFIKNDAGEHRRYYNGKLATISHVSTKQILVKFDDGSEMELEKETWRNVRYVLNEESGNIEEEELGHFSQYPIRLAWAVTIHKSQGLTFDRVIIDAGNAFAAGQVYVALSRCTTLDGIVLYSRITKESIQTDGEALRFAQQEKDIDTLQKILEAEKSHYIAKRLKKNFDWNPILRSTRAFYELVTEKKIPNQDQIQGIASLMCDKAKEQEDIALNFNRQLDSILFSTPLDLGLLKERVQKASLYFHNDVLDYIAIPLGQHINDLKNASRVKQYLKRTNEIYATIITFLEKLEGIGYGEVKLTENTNYRKVSVVSEPVPSEKSPKSSLPKEDTKLLSLSLLRAGKSLKDIALERNLTTTTVENHLVSFVKSGEVKAEELIPESTVAYLSPLLKDYTLQATLKPIKESIPSEYSYFDIKVVLNHVESLRK